MRRVFRGPRGPLAICVLLTVAHTWPLATDPATLSRNDHGDTQLNEWIMAWVLHQLPRDPLHLFDGNIFYPARDSLAFSEPLIVPALLGAPVWWAGGSPVLLSNVVLLAGFALTAFAGWILVYRWTGDRAAGLLAGSMFAFNTHTLTRIPHVQAVHAYGLPLALLAADAIVTKARTRDALLLALWMTVMAYTSGYLAVFGIVMTAVVVLARVGDWRGRAVAVLTRFAVATVVAAIAILPLYLPYRRVAREQGMVRTLESVGQFSATLKGYVAAAGTVHHSTWSGRFFEAPVDSFFPGFVVIALAVVAIVLGRRRDGEPAAAGGDAAAGHAAGGTPGVLSRRIVMLLAIAATGFILSLGTQTPIYGWLFTIFPPLAGLRAAARFGNLFLLGMACLAGIGLAVVRRRMAPSSRMSVAAVLLLAANVESLRAPLFYVPFTRISPVYSLLADEPGPVVLAEVPFFPPHAVFENAPYVLASTAHWRPLMNGYSGYTPASYRKYAAVFWPFPRDSAIDAMKEAGVTHLMVHPQRFHPGRGDVVAAISGRTDLELVAVGQRNMRLYRVRR